MEETAEGAETVTVESVEQLDSVIHVSHGPLEVQARPGDSMKNVQLVRTGPGDDLRAAATPMVRAEMRYLVNAIV